MTLYFITPISHYLWVHSSYTSYAVGSSIDPVSCSIRKVIETVKLVNSTRSDDLIHHRAAHPRTP